MIGLDLQSAIESGGEVCLEGGSYPLEQPLKLRDNVMLRGPGHILYSDPGHAMELVDTHNVRMRDFRLSSYHGGELLLLLLDINAGRLFASRPTTTAI